MLTRRHTVPVEDDVAPQRTEHYEEVVEPVTNRILQFIGLVIGIGFTVLGIAVVAKTGVDTSHIYQPHTAVWHLSQNPLMGLIEIAFGVLVVLSSVTPGGTRPALAFFGVLSFVFGLIVVTNVAPNHLFNWVAVNHRNGWLFFAVGLVLALPALLMPDRWGHRVVDERPVATRRGRFIASH